MRRRAALLLFLLATPATAKDFWTFETAPVRPLALSPDGLRLVAVNTPDARLEVFELASGTPAHVGSVPVGLEPCAVAFRSSDEAWVVNHLSDSVSIVDLTTHSVARTLHVGDEPTDIVFAGSGDGRAFIATAHRGQSSPHVRGRYWDDAADQSNGRADLWVFDASAPGAPLAVLTLFGDRPRALARSTDGASVYLAIHRSGNRTTAISADLVCDHAQAGATCTVFGVPVPGKLPEPARSRVPGDPLNPNGPLGPDAGLIVQHDGSAWRDELDRSWNDVVQFDLPDLDVFEIDAAFDPAAVPSPVQTASWAGVGTILFNMAVNPQSGRIYVSNTEARNRVRFEGPGALVSANALKPAGEPASLRGHLHEARITVLDGGSALPRHLNKHIVYGPGPATFAPGTGKQDSLATPTALATSSDGATLYVAAFGSSKVGVLSTAALEADSFTPSAADHIELAGGGPAGLALDEARGQLYVWTRFDNAIATLDLATRQERARIGMHNPEPAAVQDGRPFLYDANVSSSNGEASCASCHVFADMDDLAWDLGNPDDDPLPIGNIRLLPSLQTDFHPLKGPMTTQTLRGMATHGPMHWRGDRSGGTPIDPAASLDDAAAFQTFAGAFDALLGRDEGALPDAEMQAFTSFILEVTEPPNPIRRLDNQLRTAVDIAALDGGPGDEVAGSASYFGPVNHDGVANCDGCHALDPAQGLFGSAGSMTFDAEPQDFKVPHLRNAYQKVGMFGVAAGAFTLPGDNGFKGDQIRGFGFLHDGSTDSLFRFFRAVAFANMADDAERRALESFMMAFPATLAPIVGQQVTLRADSGDEVTDRLDLLVRRAKIGFPLLDHPGANECDLIVKGRIAGEPHGWRMDPDPPHLFLPDSASDAALSDAALRLLADVPGQELTYTCTPPGSGVRAGVDRDLDGVLDRDQCGDVQPNGLVDTADGARVRAALADPGGRALRPAQADRCSVIGGAADCDARDVVVMRRTGAALAPAPLQVCAAAGP